MGQIHKPPRLALIVEDDPDVRSLAAALIEETELEVVEATSGEEALAFLRRHAREVALVLADIRLPDRMDGVELAKRIDAAWPWIKVVVTSGDPGDRLDDLPVEATYMPKPWRALEILMAAERAAAR